LKEHKIKYKKSNFLTSQISTCPGAIILLKMISFQFPTAFPHQKQISII